MSGLYMFKKKITVEDTLLKLFFVATIVAVSASAYGQRRNSSQYVSAEHGGGLHSIQYSPIDGRHKVGAGMTFNLGYRYYLTDSWAVSGGLGLTTYNAKTLYNSEESDGNRSYDVMIPLYDSINGLDYEFRSYFNGFKEKQKTTILEIPIQAYYEYAFSPTNFEVFGKAGFKIGFPVSSKYKLLKGSYETRGYYPSLGHEIYSPSDSVYVHGYGTYEAEKQKGKMKLKPVDLSLAIEGGANYRFNNMMRFYASIYFAYCLTNIHKKSDKPILTQEYKYNGTLQSNQIDRAKLLSLGLKGGVVFDLNALLGIKRSNKKLR
jgi:hypothetical protein